MKAVPVKSLDELIDCGLIELGRGNIISKKDIAACPGTYPVYSSAKENDGKFGEYGKFMFNEELITWSVDGGGRLFHRPHHKFSVTNVGGTMRILDTSVLSYRYLYYALTIRHAEIAFDWVLKAHPSTIRKLYKDIPLPPLPEQQRIVAILDEAFAGIANARAAAEQNRQNARALFESHLQSVFSQRGEGWVEMPFGELATFRNGINFTKSSRGQSIRILGVKNFQNNFWAPLNELETVIPDGMLSDSDTLEENDLLFVRSNGNPELIGRCLLIGAVSERITYSGFTIRARLHTQDVVPQYLCHFLKSNKARREMIDGGNGANIKNLNQGTLSRLVIPFPDTSNQVALVEQLEAVQQEAQRLEALYQRKLEALDELKQSLLHQAFSGQLLGN
ncbi:restriction endonuclease subunit S [Atopomonas sediminilitoris]|uniref:restriction endonuclease subunit S n=1 Tax=Atopomonas sediminilitoris TaxID=2919919 RepID=UPI001F4E4C65|nr:restriction endonuclease subunit S [Atopomonas sediminilitoris]MCJ8167690.1 restriction endonuclease subunit S [Atopomonas sediminilitoris]